MRFALKSLILGSFLLIGACSDSPNTSSTAGPVVVVQPPEAPEALSVIVSGSIIDQSSGNIIENATLRFFEGSDLATNILNTDGETISTVNSADGAFQVTTANDITSFTVTASADGYLDKVAVVNFDANDEIVSTQLSMLALAVDAVAAVEEEITIGGSEVTEEISVTTDVANETGTTEGSAEIVVPAAVVLQDVEGNPVAVSSLSIEVSYIESQGFDEVEPSVTVITEPEEAPSSQQVYISDSQLAEDGQTVNVTLSYKSDNPATTGVGFSLNYDSETIGSPVVSNLFAGADVAGTQSADTANTDADGTTDELLSFSWSSSEPESEAEAEPEAVESVVTVPTLVTGTQHVYVSESTKSADGSQVTLTFTYLADNYSMTGVGMSVNYDSSVLTVNEVSNVLSGAIAAGQESSDSDNTDSDDSTDQLLNFGWASLFGGWPGAGNDVLATVTFDIADGATGSSAVNIVKTSTAAGYVFAGQAHEVAISAEPAEPVAPAATFPGSLEATLATISFTITEGSYGYTDLNIIETTSDSGYTFVGQSQQIAIGDEPVDEEESVSIASLIPEGLNADQTADEVLVPIGVAEITMTSDDGTQIKNFSQPITITINLPEDTEVPSQGRNVQAGDQFTVRSFDSDTLLWTTEENPATVGVAQNGLYPANLQVDHLTIFALADPVAACNSPIDFVMTGDAVPESGLQLFISSDDLEKTVTVSSSSVTISAEDAKASGFVADVNKLYQVTVTDYSGNTWYESDDGASLCGNSISVALANPVQTVDETLAVNLVCSNDDTVSTPLENAVVTYRKDATSVASVAAQSSAGVYALTQMDDSSSTYSVTIDTRTDEGVKTTTVVPDGTNESFDVETTCDSATGTGSS
jgi:hypothetical protein